MSARFVFIPLGALLFAGSAEAAKPGAKRTKRPKIKEWAQLQVLATPWDQDEDPQSDPATYGDPELDPGFTVPRGRFGITGKQKNLNYSLGVGIGAPYDAIIAQGQPDTDVQVVDAYARYVARDAIGPAFIAFGLQKVPFGREWLMSSQDLVFMERAISSEHQTHGRDTGVTAGQTWVLDDEGDAQLTLRGGAYNGNQSFITDTDPGLLVAGRLEFSIGDTYKTWSPDTDNAIGVGIAAMHNAELATNSLGLEADFLARLGPASIMVEGIRTQIDPADTTASQPDVQVSTRRFGAFGQFSYWIGTDGRQGVEIAYRVATFDDALRIQDNGDVTVMHAGLTFRDALPGFDVGGGFIHRIEVAGRDIKNDSIRLWTQIRFPVRGPAPI